MLTQAAKKRKSDDCVGVVSFDGNATARSVPAPAIEVDAGTIDRATEGNNPAAAIRLGMAMFSPDSGREMVLFRSTLNRVIGVDLEWVRSDARVDSIAARFFSAAEKQAFAELPPLDKHRAFFDCWTRKEAFIKARGDGLFLQLEQFDVSFRPGVPPEFLATRPDPSEAKRWKLSALDIGPEYAGAAVVESSRSSPTYWTSGLLGHD